MENVSVLESMKYEHGSVESITCSTFAVAELQKKRRMNWKMLVLYFFANASQFALEEMEFLRSQ